MIECADIAEYEHMVVRPVLITLATILARGLTESQRSTILREVPLKIQGERGHRPGTYFKALWDYYKEQHTISWVIPVLRSIEATRSFYQDVGRELDQLRLLTNDINRDQTPTIPYVFALLPFRPAFLAIYQCHIKPAIESLGCKMEHVQEIKTVENIVYTISAQIKRSNFLVADTSGQNPNVFYEIGLAHGIGKKVILLTQNIHDIPFDVRGLPHIAYDLDRLDVLSDQLKEVARRILQESNKSVEIILNKAQTAELHRSLLSAFPRPEDLTRMLSLQLGRSLRDIAAPTNQVNLVLELITVANSQGWIKDLVKGAVLDVPGNLTLQDFVGSLGCTLDGEWA